MSDFLAPLRDLLQSLKDRRFVLVRPGGNWGDHLIWHGAEHLADQLGVTWRSEDHDAFMAGGPASDEVVYLHGGGGFTELASGRAPACLARALQIPGATVIQGPCTLAHADALTPLLDSVHAMQAAQLYFFVREQYSEGICREILPAGIPLHLNEDTAFYLDRAAILKKIRPVRPRMHLYAVREDPESVELERYRDDRSTILDPARYAQSFEHWLRIHAAAKTLLTNRTHSAICGAILGIPTTMFSGAYHKNRSIWEFSLKQRGVKWQAPDALPQQSGPDPLLAWVPLVRLRTSWKLNRFAKRLRGVPLS
jgi:exopolysaccharide biosynthesis predicted pyruvyltransferase EpsI